MARFTSSVLTPWATNLWKISLALKAAPKKAAPKQDSNYRRIQRFLSGYEVDFTALGGLLLHLLPQKPPYAEASLCRSLPMQKPPYAEASL